jgi:cell shape-determining protein MreD
MPFWQRCLVTLAAMLVVSFIVGFMSLSMFGFDLPDYASGVVGGLTAVPLWEFLKRVKPKQ